MVALLQLSLPVIVILSFIIFKLNHDQKRWLFKIPVWISSTILSFGIGHLASGVMGFYGAAFADLLLYPAMLVVKRFWKKKDAKVSGNLSGLKEKVEPLALPQPAHTVAFA